MPLAFGAAFAFTPLAFSQISVGEFAYQVTKQRSLAECLAGSQLPEAEISEARGPASSLVRAMWDGGLALRQGASGSGRSTPRLHGKWLQGKQKTAIGSPAFLADPLAPSAGVVLVDQPLAFYRTSAEPRNEAWGLWRLVAADDPERTVGYYRVAFHRLMLKWGIRWVEPFTPERVPQVWPICGGESELKRTQGMLSPQD